jgi:RimJ/RimL family protein N-acetyltransferase
LLRYVGHWSLLGFGYWILEERATGEFVGEVGFSDYKRDVEPALGAVPEVLLKGMSSEKHFSLPERQKYFPASRPLAIVPTLLL